LNLITTRAAIQHQQKQLQELTSKSSSIDLRTTQILSTVESQGQLIIPSMRDKLQQVRFNSGALHVWSCLIWSRSL
jgi:hypothetical protein